MPRIVDLICGQAHLFVDVFLRPDQAPPPCPTCGEPRKTYWGCTKTIATETFHPYEDPVFGKVQNSDDFKLHRAAVAKSLGCSIDEIQLHKEPKSHTLARADEKRHGAWERRKRRGIDEQQLSEIRKTTRKYGFNPLTGEGRKPQ
jgi:hypothetical protein